MDIIPTGVTSHIVTSYNQYQTVLFASIATGIVLLVSLAWNDVVQTIINNYYPQRDNSVIGKLQYAFIVTFIVVILQIYILPYFTNTKEK